MASPAPTASEPKHPTDASAPQRNISVQSHSLYLRIRQTAGTEFSTPILISGREGCHLHHSGRAPGSHLVPLWTQTHPPYLTERDPNGPRKELNMQGYNQRSPISLRSPKKIECCVSKWANVIRYVRKAMTILPVVRHKILREEQVRPWH